MLQKERAIEKERKAVERAKSQRKKAGKGSCNHPKSSTIVPKGYEGSFTKY
jgi:hypothetical protein